MIHARDGRCIVPLPAWRSRGPGQAGVQGVEVVAGEAQLLSGGGGPVHDRPENHAFRAVVNRAQSAAEQLRLTGDYFDALAAGCSPALSAAA